MKSRRVRVALPRPKGTRASSRAELSITMHPRELLELEARARSRSMSITAYVRALLASDADDVAPPAAPRRTFSLAELATDAELVGAGALHAQIPRTPENVAKVRAFALDLGAPLADDECSACGRVPYAEGHAPDCARPSVCPHGFTITTDGLSACPECVR